MPGKYIQKELELIRNYLTPPGNKSYDQDLFKLEISRTNLERVAFFSLIFGASNLVFVVANFICQVIFSNVLFDLSPTQPILFHSGLIVTFLLLYWLATAKKSLLLAQALKITFAAISILTAIAVSFLAQEPFVTSFSFLIVICLLLIIFYWSFPQSLILILSCILSYFLFILFASNELLSAQQIIYTLLFSLIFFFLSRNNYRNKVQEFIQSQEKEDQSQLLQIKNEELNHAHATLSSIDRNIVQGFFRLDRKGNLLYANKFLSDLFGYASPEEMVHQWSPEELFNATEIEAISKVLTSKKYLKNKEVSFKREGKAVFWGILNCYLEYQHDEIYFDGTLIDNTDRKNEQILLENLSLVASNTDNAVFIINNDEKIEWVNNAFTQQTGYSLKEAIGRKPGNLFQGKNIDPHTIFKIGDRISKGLGFTGELLNYHKDGHEFWVHIALNPILNDKNEIVKYVVVQSDITDRKNVEKELIKAKEEAERLVKVKEEFLSMVSHELRTPLNAVIGMSHLLLQESPRPDQVQSLQSLKVSGEYLLSLINDILDFSKIEAGKITIDNSAFNFKEFITSLEQTFYYLAEEKNIQFNVKLPTAVPDAIVGDPVRLNQILFNLIGNALKFTDTGVVELEVDVLHQDKNNITMNFIVRDTGIGIPPEKLAAIFDRFEQVNPNSTLSKRGGTGLGLAITKKLIEMMDGSINVESTENEGSTFYVQLSFENNANLSVKPLLEENNGEDFSRLNLLLVEDNKINQMVAIKFMKKWNINYQVVENGQRAYETAKKVKFNMILMDLQMPEMDGYQSTQLIRKLPGYEKVPILALTAASLDVKGKVLAAGMNDFIIKPFNPVELYSKLKKYNIDNRSKTDGGSTFDLEEIKRIASGDQQFIIELVDICIEQFDSVPSQIKDAYAKHNTEEVLELMHKIKPSIKMLNSPVLEQAAKELVTCFKLASSSDSTMTKRIDHFAHISHQIKNQLREKASELKALTS